MERPDTSLFSGSLTEPPIRQAQIGNRQRRYMGILLHQRAGEEVSYARIHHQIVAEYISARGIELATKVLAFKARCRSRDEGSSSSVIDILVDRSHL